MTEQQAIPHVWDAGDDYVSTINEIINEHVYCALKEYIESARPWMHNGKIELYIDEAEVTSERVTLAECVLHEAEGWTNPYWGLVDKERIGQIKAYLFRIIGRLDEILAAGIDDPKEHLSKEDRIKFDALFEDNIQPLDEEPEPESEAADNP